MINLDEMGGVRSTHWRAEKFTHNFGRKTLREDNTRKTEVYT